MIRQFVGEYRFLSNFWYVPIRNNFDQDFILYPTVEHAFQAAKTLDFDTRLKIKRAATPSDAKYLGRIVQLREDWNALRFPIMLELVRYKFKYNDSLRQKLINTGNQGLMEGNTWHDNYWGACTCAMCHIEKKHNVLGKILMMVREELGD